MTAGIFPLELVDFEYYMVADDARDYPMVIRTVLEFDGRLNPDRLESALQITQRENPLLRARIEEQAGKLYWVDADPVSIEWNTDAPKWIRLDLATGPGTRIFARQQNHQTRIDAFFHHAIADGGGLLHFIESWLGHYESLRSAQPPVLSDPPTTAEVDHEVIKKRGRFGMNLWKYLLRPVQEFCGFVGVIEYFSHRPVAIGPQSRSEMNPTPDPEALTHDFQTVQFSSEQTASILQYAKRTKQKVNDLMLASMYQACQSWLEKHQPDQASRHIRIMIPMDMRSRKQPEKFVGNMVSMIFLDRRPGRYRSLKSICRYVRLEMNAIKLMRTGLTFVHLIRLFRIQKRLEKLLRQDRSIASTILSNMGPILARTPLTQSDRQVSVDGVRLKQVHFYPPIRPFTWITSVVTTYGNRFQVHSTWCSAALQSSDADEILADFQANLLKFVESES